LRVHRIATGIAAAVQKNTRLRAQPGTDIYTSIILPFPPSLWRVKGSSLFSTDGEGPVKLTQRDRAAPKSVQRRTGGFGYGDTPVDNSVPVDKRRTPNRRSVTI
jgi:hypothetical protein